MNGLRMILDKWIAAPSVAYPSEAVSRCLVVSLSSTFTFLERRRSKVISRHSFRD